jgi:hypothetical protein
MVDKQARVRSLEKRIERFERQLAALNSRSDRYSWLRLGIFLGGVAASLIVFFAVGLRPAVGLLLITIIAFSAAVYAQRQIKGSILRHKIWITLKTQQIARIKLKWSQIPLPPYLPVTPQHPFALDLDLVGERSVAHLLNTAVSYEGGLRLQEWLLTTIPNPAASLARQRLVCELAPMVRFRDKLSLNALLTMRKSNQQNAILRWLQQDDQLSAASLTPMMIVFTGLAILNAVLWIANMAGILPALWQLTVVIYLALYSWNVKRLGDVFETAAVIADELERLRAVFHQLETYPYRAAENTALKELAAPFLDATNRPSAKLRRLTWIMSAASIRGNGLLWLLLNTLAPWDMVVAYFFKRIKTDLATLIPRWLDVWFQLEALGSLASFAYLNPEYTFPDLLTSGMALRGKALGHPLIPFDHKVCNAFTIESSGEVDIITGSNMAGKSSFLRTLGVNLCLAYAGGPVNAAALSVSPFRLFTCIKVSDSVTDGVSYFYAEVKRLKALLNALQQQDALPLFFLIDEIFRGTNNRERLIGSRAYIQALVHQNGVGLIATHDLELIKLADELPKIKNYHFEESIIDRQMIFDYKLRPGPSPTTNALKIMAMEGLPVPPQ